ncbi:DUF1428 domain-containing protein [bacterium]|nr:DUF1428 domain-containing protein [bacterium]
MNRYIDGFVLPIAKDRLDKYESIAKVAAQVWKDCGALEYWECVGDDLNMEQVRSFREMAGAKEHETVMFAWVVFELKEARNLANQKIMNDPRMNEIWDPNDPNFDPARMAMGGFRELLSL